MARPGRRSAHPVTVPAALSLLLALAACEGPPEASPGESDPPPPAEAAEADRPGAVPAPADASDVEDARASLPEGAEAVSLLGSTLEPPPLPDDVRATYRANLESAEADLAAAPESADALIWVGRRLAYLGRYRDAIDVYTRAIALHPDDARLYRHRGHRWITVREFDRAIRDLRHAARLIEGTEDRVEPDGLPNELGIPTSTLHFNIYYHLGLAHYLKGEFPQALLAWNDCMEASLHPDSVVATAYWLNNVMRRLDLDGRADELLAGIDDSMDIIESDSYLDVLLLWKGERTPGVLRDAAGGEGSLAGVTTEYGIGMWHYGQGRRERAYELWEAILEREGQWPAFGYIAAEAEMARIGEATTDGMGSEGGM